MTGAGLVPLTAHDHPAWEDFSALAWVVVGVAGVAAAWVIWKAVRYTFHPGEEDPGHIKRSILDEPEGPPMPLSSDDDGSLPREASAVNGDGA